MCPQVKWKSPGGNYCWLSQGFDPGEYKNESGWIKMPLFECDPLLQEREKTHGSFKLNAEISQRLKTLFSEYPSYAAMSNVQREALDMIALKLSRVLSGQWDYKDHFDDIAGYAKLASEACDK